MLNLIEFLDVKVFVEREQMIEVGEALGYVRDIIENKYQTLRKPI